MNRFSKSRFLPLAILALFLVVSATAFCAENILFFGNSYTFSAMAPAVQKLGGVPKLVEAIADAKGRKTETTSVTAGGKDFGYHLKQAETEKALNSKIWNWVVLQDYSVQTTHLGNLNESIANGESFYKRIRSHSPEAGIVLYETWARGRGNSVYTGLSTPKSFVDPEQMTAEIQKGYAEIKTRLEAIDPGDQVRVAPVGTAFALCQKKHPEIDLYSSDHHHASEHGYYLAALVIYATIYHDNPLGAIHEFPGITFEPGTAEKLQQIAAETVKMIPAK